MYADKALGQLPVVGVYFNAISAKTMTWRLGILFIMLSTRGEEFGDKNIEETAKMIRLVFPQKDAFSFKQPDYKTFEKLVLSITGNSMEEFEDKVKKLWKYLILKLVY